MPRFPTSVGILLGLGIALHVAALVELLLGVKVDAASLFLVGQFVVSLSLLRLYDGKWVFQDIRLFFVIFLFLYGATLPVAVLLGFLGEEPGIAGAAFMYATAFLGFNVVQWWYRQGWHDVPAEVFARIKPTFMNTLMVVGALAFIALYAALLGLEVSMRMDRTQVTVLGTQLWVVSMFILNGFVMYMFAGWSNLPKSARIALVGVVLGFIAFQLALGNRRDFLPMSLFIVGIIATHRHAAIRLGTVLFGFLAFAAFTAVGIIRMVLQDPTILTRINPVQILITQNEFVSPIYTLIHYVNSDRPLRLGFTYLYAPGLFMPRAIWPDKPESLSIQFMRDAFNTTTMMGFAYTPVTEAFLNFSWVGPFMIFTIVSLLLVKLVRNADAHPGLYFIAFALVVDFNRGDFGGTLYSLVVMGGAYALMAFVSRLRWNPSKSGQWAGQADTVIAPRS
ncbi:MAG: hypothetical protein ABI556_05315 [Gemmatimonadales bacterium]